MAEALSSFVDLSTTEPRWCTRCGKAIPHLRAHLLHRHTQQWSYYLYQTDQKRIVLEMNERDGSRR